MLCSYMTCQNLNNSACKLKCEERGITIDIMLIFMYAMKNQIMTSHVMHNASLWSF